MSSHNLDITGPFRTVSPPEKRTALTVVRGPEQLPVVAILHHCVKKRKGGEPSGALLLHLVQPFDRPIPLPSDSWLHPEPGENRETHFSALL